MRSNKTLRYYSAHVKKLPQLTSREKEVVVGRLKKITLEMIGRRFGVSEGRIRQIELKALLKIKSKKQQLRLFK